MNYDKELLDKVYLMYAQEKVNENPSCVKCKECAKSKGKEKKKELIYGPVPIYHIGKNFTSQKKKLLIVGMVAYGWGDKFNDDFQQTWKSIINKDSEAIQNIMEKRVEELYTDKKKMGKSKYFRYINYALEKEFGDTKIGYDSIAISNLVHCNTGSVNDNLPQSARNFCIDPSHLELIHKEIDVIKPTHILILTKNWNYTKHIVNLYKDKEKYKTLEIQHPSGRRRVKEAFAEDVVGFMKDE